MNILFVSKSHSRGIRTASRILDCFGLRMGTGAWQTPITEVGLAAVHAELKKAACSGRRGHGLAVACHKMGRHGAELLWIVGERSSFDRETGAVPVSVSKNIHASLKEDAATWKHLPLIRALSSLAAFFHDFGKSSKIFQNKLRGRKPGKDIYRHEFVSTCLFSALVRIQGNTDEGWLAFLESLPSLPSDEIETVSKHVILEGIALFEGKPLSGLPPLAFLVAWLILSHHRLPVFPTGPKGDPRGLVKDMPENIDKTFHKGAGATDSENKETKAAQEDIKIESLFLSLADNFASGARNLRPFLGQENQSFLTPTLARLGLMFGDHLFSSQKIRAEKATSETLYANTVSPHDEEQILCNQYLDEHLRGVSKSTDSFLRYLPRFKSDVSVLGRVEALRARSSGKFAWQNRPYDLCKDLAEQSESDGFFCINAASTGMGKTFANARICYALGRNGARFTVATGLRVLTLQTAEAFREKMKLDKDALAVLVNGAAKKLFEMSLQKNEDDESDEDIEPAVIYEGQVSEVIERKFASDPGLAAMVSAPVLVSTVDHIVRASEGSRGGKQIAPILRLMSADLVIDEPDEFNLGDIPALTRLVFMTGLFGSRLVLSTATIPPALAHGLFLAYVSGREIWAENAGKAFSGTHFLFCDEFGAKAEILNKESFPSFYEKRIKKRLSCLQEQKGIRALFEIPFESESKKGQAESVLAAAIDCHHRLGTEHGGKKISIGLVRFSRILDVQNMARELAKMPLPEDTALHLCCYHSRLFLPVRAEIEKNLDILCSRKDSDEEFISSPIVRSILVKGDSKNHICLVIASPVAEVGRDHDYDYALAEVSSLRSIVQIAGRVRRHRGIYHDIVNVGFFSRNMRQLDLKSKTEDVPTFKKPGFETKNWRIRAEISEALPQDFFNAVTSSPCVSGVLEIAKTPPGKKSDFSKFADLEQYAMSDCMAWSNVFYETQKPALSGIIQQKQPFRRKEYEEIEIYRDFDDTFQVADSSGNLKKVNSFFKYEEEFFAENVFPLFSFEYADLLEKIAKKTGMGRKKTMLTFSTLRLRKDRLDKIVPWNDFLGA